MALYEITNEFAQLFDQFDELNGWEPDTDADGNTIDASGNIIDNPVAYKEAMLQAWFDTLEGIEEEFEQKAENVACYIKSLKAEVKAYKDEESALKARRERKERQLKSLTTYLMGCMEAASRTKLDMPRAQLSIRNNAESLVIDDEISLISWLQENNEDMLKYSMPEIKKTEVKKLVKAGVQFPYMHTERSKSLIIK